MPPLFHRHFSAAALTLAISLTAVTSTAHAWSHQGHILITRMAALRIINDPASPPALVAFLKFNLKYDLEACKKLATVEEVGDDPKNYLAGLDGAATLPDRIQGMPEGKKILEPYGVTEGKGMHFMDMEWLAPIPAYNPDLSNRPDITKVPHDVHDPRWKLAGYVPFRVEEYYNKTILSLGPNDKPADNDKALHDLGYLCHYIEDSHQPLHATIDYRSYSYLVAAGVKGVHEVKTHLANGGTSVTYRADDFKGVNPHGDIEFQLFENAKEPRLSLRKQFWDELVARIDKKAAAEKKNNMTKATAPVGTFQRDLEILSDSYDYLPAVGKAAAAGYATGKFDPVAFFNSEDTIKGEKMTIIQLIADRNAAAVLEVEKTIRQVWADSKDPAKAAAAEKFLKDFYAPTSATDPATAPTTGKAAAFEPPPGIPFGQTFEPVTAEISNPATRQ